MKTAFMTLGAAAMAFAFATTANAGTITIDSFNDGLTGASVANGGTATDSDATGNAIGGWRDLTVTNNSGGAGQTTAGSTFVHLSAGTFAFDNAATADGEATLTYGLQGDLNLDLSGYKFINIDVLSIDVGSIDFTLDIDGTTATQTLMNGETGILSFSLAGYAGLGDVDVISLTLSSIGSPSVDATLGGITAAVPLPAGGLLLLTALGGVAAVRRKKSA